VTHEMKMLSSLLGSGMDQRFLNGGAILCFRECQGFLNRQHYKRLRKEYTLCSWWVT